jgi:hypothetical protein
MSASDSNLPEPWLRGDVAGVPPALQPVAHALVQAWEDAERAVAHLDSSTIWASPGGAASIGFHLRHMAGSLDRLLTYARGEPLTDAQRTALRSENDAVPQIPAERLLVELRAAIDRAMAQVRATPVDGLDQPRAVGRAGLPSTVRGLLHHAGEHTGRHAAQIITTVKILTGLRKRS